MMYPWNRVAAYFSRENAVHNLLGELYTEHVRPVLPDDAMDRMRHATRRGVEFLLRATGR